jgi:hypothetical protein
MNKKINLVELLRDCPKGTKFYSRALGTVTFNCIKSDMVCINDHKGIEIAYAKSGKYYYAEDDSVIDLFPSRDQRDWSKWQRPFVEGDIVMYGDDQFAIFKEYIKHPETGGLIRYYLYYDAKNDDLDTNDGQAYVQRLATEKEKAELFQAIKDNGYKWDPGTKTLEKLIEPKFKVGNTIRSKNGLQAYTITGVTSEYYSVKVGEHACVGVLRVKDQDDWILIQNKFDIKTLQHFDKVLVRQYDVSAWCTDFFSYYDEVEGYAVCTGDVHYDYCIPYNEDTKHLVGKSKDAPTFYRYWEDK